MTLSRKLSAAALVAVALAAVAATPAAANASGPAVGISVSGNPALIGDLPGTTGWYPAPYGEFGNDPMNPGGTWTGSAKFTNTGTDPETVSCAQHGPPRANGTIYPNALPASWISATLTGDPSGVLQPGQVVIAEIVVDVPSDAVPLPYSPPVFTSPGIIGFPPTGGYYGGSYSCSASAIDPATGETTISTGAGLGEYLRVVPPGFVPPV